MDTLQLSGILLYSLLFVFIIILVKDIWRSVYKNPKECILVDYLVKKHKDGEIDWKPGWSQDTITSYKATVDALEIRFLIFRKGGYWVQFEGYNITFMSRKFKKIEIIGKDLKTRTRLEKKEPEIDRILSNFKNLERDAKISAVLRDTSIITKIKNIFVKKS